MVYGADPQPKLAIQSLPRGNGKTGLVSALVLCHLLGPEAEARGEVYSVAITQNQAAHCPCRGRGDYKSSAGVLGGVRITEQRKRIEVLEGDGVGSTYASLAADHGPALGLAPSLWVYDEMGATKDRRLFDALLTASGKRTNTLGVVISTQAEVDDHHFSVLIDEARAGRARNVACQIMVAPMDADPFDIETLRTCNPAAGIYLNESDLVAKAEMAANTACVRTGLSALSLNQRVRTDEDARIVDAATWNRGAVPVDEAKPHGQALHRRLRQRREA